MHEGSILLLNIVREDFMSTPTSFGSTVRGILTVYLRDNLVQHLSSSTTKDEATFLSKEAFENVTTQNTLAWPDVKTCCPTFL